MNNGLKKLVICQIDIIDEKVSTAMRLGLGKNPMLESLNLLRINGRNDPCLWREALSFLRTNLALNTLHMSFAPNVSTSHAAAIRMEVPAALC